MWTVNNQRRDLLKRATGLLNTASSLVSTVIDGEEDALDNVPENLQGSERYEKIENALDCLNEASENIDAAIEKLNEAAS